jgi:hypothetical protein
MRMDEKTTWNPNCKNKELTTHCLMTLSLMASSNPATIKVGNVPWSSQNMNSQFTITASGHSSKCRT